MLRHSFLVGRHVSVKLVGAIVACFVISAAATAQLQQPQPPPRPAAVRDESQPAPLRAKPANTSNPASDPNTRKIVLLLPSEQTLFRRAAGAVRDGVRAALAQSGVKVELRECAYGTAEAVAEAYDRCGSEEIDVIIGPLGRSEVSALSASAAKRARLRPTLMLSPLGGVPPRDFYVLAPELETEAELIAKQALEDACRKPVLVDAGGAIAARVSAAVAAYFKASGAATPLAQHELGARERWPRLTDGWRRDGVDCLLFAGGGATFGELRPYLRNITSYVTSASYEAELDAIVDWTGVRIADAPFLLDALRPDFANLAPAETASPTLARLFALGVDATRIALLGSESGFSSASRGSDQSRELGEAPATAAAAAAPAARAFLPPESFDGAIGRLRLRDGQYVRTPAMGEFRVRVPIALGL